MQLRVSGAAFFAGIRQANHSIRPADETDRCGTWFERSDRSTVPKPDEKQEKTKEEFVPG